MEESRETLFGHGRGFSHRSTGKFDAGRGRFFDRPVKLEEFDTNSGNRGLLFSGLFGREVPGQSKNSQKEHAMKTLFNRFANDESGATAIEYGLIAALIAVAVITALNVVGTELTGTFTKVSTELTAANAK